MHPPATKKVKLRSPHLLTTKQAKSAAGSAVKLARALGITKAAVGNWGTHPPLDRQQQIVDMFGEKP